VTAPGRDGRDIVGMIGQLLGLAAGIIALVYAAGGGVLALRLYLAHLPSRTIVGQLPRDLVISIGLANIVLPVLAVAALYAAYRILRGESVPPTRLVGQFADRSPRAWAAVVGASALPALVVAVVIAVAAEDEDSGSKQLLWLDPIEKLAVLGFLVTLLAVLVALDVRARLVRRYREPASLWSTRRAIASVTTVVALAAVPVCVMLSGAFFPLLDARVCTRSTAIDGVLIGETSARTYVGETRTEPGPLLVFSIPSSEIQATYIGGDADRRACPT
jgi:hypothetical protein